MITKELIDYIKNKRSLNTSDDEIRDKLKKYAWKDEDINDAFNDPRTADVPIPPYKMQDYVKQQSLSSSRSMWDAFQHVLMFISMGVVAIAIGLLIHEYINYFIPEYRGDPIIRLPDVKEELASIIVTLPIFLFLFNRINKQTEENPAIRQLKARTVLTYLTLIITFIIVVSNVIHIVYNFLDGSVTANFVAHFLNTTSISGIIFWYFLNQVRYDRKAS